MAFLTFDPKIQSYQSADKLLAPAVVNKMDASPTSHHVADGKDHLPDLDSWVMKKNLESAYGKGSAGNELVPAIIAEQIMTSPIVTLSDRQTIGDARQLFKQRGFRHVPIVNQKSLPAGIISDRDLLRHYSDRPNTPLVSFVTQQVLVASPDTEIREIARVLLEQRIGGIPIVSSKQLLVGIVTRSDILRILVNRAPLALWV